jgi:hypothetical protein
VNNVTFKLNVFRVLLVFQAGIMISCGEKAFTPGYVPTMSPIIRYDRENEVTFTGQIIDIIRDTTPPPIMLDEGHILGDDERTLISVVVTTYKGHEDHTYLVQLGPKWYLDLKGIHLLKKKEITVSASPIETPDLVDKRGSRHIYNEEGILLARVLQVGDYKITLRDENGVPVWYQRGRIKGILGNWQEQMKKEEMKKYMEQQMGTPEGSQKLPAQK